MGFLTDKLGPAPRWVWIVGGVVVAVGLRTVLGKRGKSATSTASTTATADTAPADSGSASVSRGGAGVGDYAGLVQALTDAGMVVPAASPQPAPAGGKVATPTRVKPAKAPAKKEPHKDAAMPAQSKNKKPVIHHAPVTKVSPKINARGGVGNKPYGPKAN